MRSLESNTLDKYKNFQYCHFSKWFPHEWIASNWLQLPLGWPRHDWKNLIKLSRIELFSIVLCQIWVKLFDSPMEKTYFRRLIFDSYKNSDFWQSNFCLVLLQVPKCFVPVLMFCVRPKIYWHMYCGSHKHLVPDKKIKKMICIQ